MAVCRLAPLAIVLLAAWSASASRTLHQASNSTTSSSTTEPNTYLEASSILSSAASDSAAACSKSCVDTSNCYVWAWCPGTEAGGCSVYYGSVGPVDPAPATPVTIKAGTCQLSTDVSDGVFSLYASRGAKVPFTSGIVRRPAPVPWVPPDPKANATSSGIISFVDVVDGDCHLACKKAGLSALDFGDPAQQICAVALNGRDWWGVHSSGTKACFYAARAADGQLPEQGKAETAAGETQAAYRCACIKEEDKKRAEWKEALTCPAGFSPHDSDVNMCRINFHELRPSGLSAGWIQTDTCYFRRSASESDSQATGVGPPTNMAVLCLKD